MKSKNLTREFAKVEKTLPEETSQDLKALKKLMPQTAGLSEGGKAYLVRLIMYPLVHGEDEELDEVEAEKC